MHELYELKEKLMDELKEYGSKDEMTAGTLEVVDKLAHTIKNLCKIIEDAEEYSEAYGGGSYEGSYDGSYEGRSMRGGSYARGGSMRGGSSYARGRGRNAKRDSMGRYSSDNDMIIEQLRDLMEEAPDMKTRQEIERFVKKMESMK